MTDRLSALERHWQKPWLYFLLLTALAAATPLAFAPYYHFWLMPLLLAALFRLTELKPQRRVSSGYWFGLVAYGSQFWWIHTSMHDIGGMPEIYAVPLTLLLPAFLALYPAAVFWLLEKYRLPRWAQTGIVLPLLWTLAEFARERVLTGFGWGAVGYSQIADYSPLAGFAPVGGIHLVTLATVLLAGWLVLAVNNHILRQRLLFAAAALALHAGLTLPEIAAGLARFANIKGRLQRKAGIRGSVILDDTYNANPDSMKAAIDVLAALPAPRVFVMGDMGELGDDEAGAMHAEIGAYARDKGIEAAYFVGDYSVEAAETFGADGLWFAAKDPLIQVITHVLPAGASVLVKGSRFMEMEEVAAELTDPELQHD